MPKRIGLLTFHRVINEGAMLQTYYLFTKLQQLFKDDLVEVIDYRSLIVDKGYWKYIVSDTRNPAIMLQRASRCRRLNNFISHNVILSSTQLISDDYDSAVEFLVDKYDLIVVGSDEIWKLEDGPHSLPFPNIYWLSDRLTCRKMAYAASANRLAYRDLTVDQRRWINEQLTAYDLIGVRDNHTVNMIREIAVDAAAKTIKVPDPTFLLPLVDMDVRPLLQKHGVDLARPVLGITFYSPDINRDLLDMFRAKGYQTVGITAFNPDADVNLIDRLDPFQWSLVFQFFSFCLTNLFHGTIFSLKARIPFLSFDYSSRFNGDYETKLKCLLGEFQLADRYIPVQDDKVSASQVLCRAEEVLRNHDPICIQHKLDETSQRADRFFEEARQRLD